MIRTKAILFFCVSALILLTTGFSCTLFQSSEAEKETHKQITLNYWGVFDDADAVSPLIAAYRRMHPNVSIEYRKFQYEEYEDALLNAFAEDRGPDIFMIHNTWVDKYMTKIQPMPQTLKVGFLVQKGTIKKVIVSEIHNLLSYTPRDMREQFVPTVADDVMRTEKGQEKIYGIPFSVDTLALFYNSDLFNSASVGDPPKDWIVEFPDAVKKLTIINDAREMLQSGAAFGAAKNVERASDILAALMMQRGVQLSRDGQVTFNQMPVSITNQTILPAVDALRYYTDFAAPQYEQRSWDESYPNSFEAFSQGKTAIFFGYSYHAAQLRSRFPQLKFRVAPLPQNNPTRPVTSANYWINSVSKKTAVSDYAWDFLKYSSQKEQESTYLKGTQKPTSLRALIQTQKQDEQMSPFVSQVLFAKNWYHGKNPQVMEKAFQDLITQSLTVKGGPEELGKLEEYLNRAQQTIQAEY